MLSAQADRATQPTEEDHLFESESTTTTTAQSDFLAPNSSAASSAAEPVYPFRLLADEKVLGMYPIARKRRPFGKLVSYLFVTDSRVIYSAEGKAFSSSSFHSKEYQVSTIRGIEVGRHRGLDALGVSAAIGVILNFIGMLILAGIAGGAGSSSYMGYGTPSLGGISGLFGFLAVASLIVGAVVIFILRRPTASLKIVGPNPPQAVAKEGDLPKFFVTVMLFLIFGLFIGFTLILWAIIRELGVFRADYAQLYAEPDNIDRIAHEMGALILDVQARGKLAGKN
jgi:hypothetical protein